MAITYFAKEGLQGFVVACSCGSSLARHVGLYPGSLQGAAGPHQAQVCQPFLEATSVMQELDCASAALLQIHAFTHLLPNCVCAPTLAFPHNHIIVAICLYAYALALIHIHTFIPA